MGQDFRIPNRHGQFVPPTLWTAQGEYLSLYENAHGEQLILNVNRHTKSGHFSSGDAEWELQPVSADAILPDFRFDPPELAWYIACWMAILGKPLEEVAAMCRQS